MNEFQKFTIGLFVWALFLCFLLVWLVSDTVYQPEPIIVTPKVPVEPFNAQKYCNRRSQMKVSKLKEMFYAFDAFASELKLDYFLMYGSLLGMKRFGGLIPYDHDVDVAILQNDTLKIEEVGNWTHRLSNLNYYYLLLQPWWRKYPSERNVTSIVEFREPNARFKIRYGSVWIDIWSMLPHPTNESVVQYQDKYQKWKLVNIPLNLIYPLQRCQFEDLWVNCPRDMDAVIHLIYGPDITPSQKCVRGVWKLSIKHTNTSREW